MNAERQPIRDARVPTAVPRWQQSGYSGTIIRDPSDTRDLLYRPTLGPLQERFLCAAMAPANSAYRLNLPIRNQGTEPRCIGDALAALVDIQRIETFCRKGDLIGAQSRIRPSSGQMLYAMALEVEGIEQGRPSQDVYSLRSGLKGFYNTGVCSETTWNERPLNALGDNVETASVEAMREARNLTLGAYYRVPPFINDYHAALIEAGALYVSAELHDGWEAPKNGAIAPANTSQRLGGGHAFVIVGYDESGFLVLNSWGPDWGGYAFDAGPPLPGIALWPYADWAGHVIDAWALRLAAPTPGSFRFAVGPKGTAMFGGVQAAQAVQAAPSVRRLEVLGHYIHLDDGRHVTTGSYPDSRHSLETTLGHLMSPAKRTVTDIRLTFNGDITPTDQVMARIARSQDEDRVAGVHGLSLLWVNGLLSGAADALKPLFEAALAIAKGDRDDANRRIEQMSRPVGRALWRDARRAATTAADLEPEGDAAYALRQIVSMCAKSGKRLHIVSEGAGVLLLAALLCDGPDRDARDTHLIEVLASLTLVAPLITAQDFNPSVGRFLDVWHSKEQRRATLFRPRAAFDQRLTVGPYSGSWTDLVSRAFEETPTRLVGAFDFRGLLRGNPIRKRLDAPEQPAGDLSATAVLQHVAIKAHLAQVIAAFRAAPPPPPLIPGGIPDDPEDFG